MGKGALVWRGNISVLRSKYCDYFLYVPGERPLISTIFPSVGAQMRRNDASRQWYTRLNLWYNSVSFIRSFLSPWLVAFFHSLISFVCLWRGQNWLRVFLEAWLHSNYFLWKHMFDFFDNHDECRKSCFIRQKIRSIFSPFWSILRPIWSILTLFNAKALFSALMSEFFTHFLSPSFKGFKDLCYPVCDY